MFASKSLNTLRSGAEGGFLLYNVTINLNTYEGESIVECTMEKIVNVSRGGFSSFLNNAIKNLKFAKEKRLRTYESKDSFNFTSMNSFDLAKTKTLQTAPAEPEKLKRQPRKSTFRRVGNETPGLEDGSEISMQASPFEIKDLSDKRSQCDFCE